MKQDFTEIAADAAHELEKKYHGRPDLELVAWLQIALQREAMVSEAYDGAFVDSQLAVWKKGFGIDQKVVEVVARTLMGVWAQENGHQGYFKALLRGINPSENLMVRIKNDLLAIRGRLEGKFIGAIISPEARKRYAARVAIVIGKITTKVPDYVSELKQTQFSQFCAINADLEHTAVIGYERMMELGRSIPDYELFTDTALFNDLERTGTDETYHEELFSTLANWPPDPPPGGTPTVHSPMGPESKPWEEMTVADVRGLILQAKTFAYGSQNIAIGDSPMKFDEQLIFNDPLVRQLRKLVATEEAEGEKPRYVTAGA
jgi:hypothetical protein